MISAYQYVVGNVYIRRLAEALAVEIGNFAEKNSLKGDLCQRIEIKLKSETGESLTKTEQAWCSSFNQNIDDLAERSSQRLVKLLAYDYNKRFENNK